jgi:hypothetical protein
VSRRTSDKSKSRNPSRIPVLKGGATHGALKATDLALLYHVLAAVINRAAQLTTTAAQDIQVEQLLSKEEQSRLGIAAMPPDKKAAMRDALIRLYQQGYRAGQLAGRPVAAAPTGSVVETQVDGDFNGWEGETIVKLMNGQIWQQTEYRYEYHYAFMPKVLVYPSGSGFKMKVDGTSQPVGVERLR